MARSVTVTRPIMRDHRVAVSRTHHRSGGPMAEDWTPGELTRRLEDVVRRLETFESAFVRKDLYEARHTNITRRIDLIERDNDERERSVDTFRRQVYLVIITTAIPALLGLLLAINNFLASGGKTP
jgi:hypothetical protein